MIYDVIVIGGSSGAIEPLQQLLAELPADLPAAVFVVVHTAPDRPSRLPEVLSRYASITASNALHGEKIKTGHVYVAPSDNHLSLQRDYVRVVRGPRVNGQRPAVDALFRSAAREFGPRVIGVLLSGQLDCGTAGLLAIRARGGLTVVQDPAEATFPDMPSNALRHVQIDHVLSAKPIGGLLARLAGNPVQDPRVKRPAQGGSAPTLQSKIQEQPGELMRENPGHGIPGFERNLRLSPVTCPECDGTMIESEDQDLLWFKCHVGHVFSLDNLAAEQEHAVEAALWAALRALEESEIVNRRMSERADQTIAERFSEKSRAMGHYADTIRRILLSGRVLPSPVDEASESAVK